MFDLRDDIAAALAVFELEKDYDSRDARNHGWWPPREGHPRGFYSIKEDGYETCDGGDKCSEHVGEAMYVDAPKYHMYGDGWYEGEYGKMPRYGIPLIEDHWRRPCP